jgi:iron complex transport system substrate-binding protein
MEEGSEERVPDMNGDLILVSRYGQDHARLDAIMATPQWKGLPAVQAGAVREVNDDVWMLGIGIVAATTVVEELPALLPA